MVSRVVGLSRYLYQRCRSGGSGLKIAAIALICLMAWSVDAFSAQVTGIKVNGNQRIGNDSILYHLGLKIGDEIDDIKLNTGLKALFDTNLFADVKIRNDHNLVTVDVIENPIINRVVFEGNRRINDDALKSEVYMKPRDVFTKSRVQADTLRILSLYRRQGRFAATVEPKIIKLEQNRVDLVFEINESKLTGVKKILFVGNQKFSTSKLQSVLRTKETRWYRFLTNDDNYDPERIAFDRELLRVHYLKNGYVDFKVLSSIAELATDKSGFFITFTIEEGTRYRVGEVKINCQLKNIDEKALKHLLELKTRDWYDGGLVEKSMDKITDYLGDMGYAFVNVKPDFKKNPEEKTVDITFDVTEGARVYIGQIDIHGNLATYDKVVRREFRLYEGDAYNTSKLRRSEQRLQNLNFFSTVNVEKEQGDAPDKVNLKVNVKEKSTGEISVAGGVTSIEGMIGNVRFSENNFMGKGQQLSSDFTISKRTREFDVSFTEPYFLDKNLSAGVDLFKVRYDQTSQNGYIHHRHGGTTRIGYHITEPLVHRVWYTVRQDRVSSFRDDASIIIREQQGTRNTSLVGHELSYDKRDNRIDPTTGYVLSLTNEYAGLGGQTKFLRHNTEGKSYYSLSENVVFTLRASGGLMQIVQNQPIKTVDRFFLGGDSLRGFEYFGVSPREITRSEAVGGRYYYTGSAEVSFPIGLPNELGIKGSLFADVGSIWKSDYSKDLVNDSSKVRSSVGFGIAWASPLGPIRLDIARATRYQKFDKRQPVLFSFRTTF
ncbi:MAG: outer membrane protein assembly factor BamA [Alphaproteobacteria bacterium]|nr:outer membrane protein assembly factor BamA [Alphaproteobacteria bacterium]